MTQIKICGLSREADIGYVNEARPDCAGFILHFPKSRRNLSPEAAAVLRRQLFIQACLWEWSTDRAPQTWLPQERSPSRS